MSSQKGSIVIPLVIAGVVLLIVALGFIFGKDIFNKPDEKNSVATAPAASSTPIPMKEEFQNPFDEKSQYKNPFSESGYTNPFESLEK